MSGLVEDTRAAVLVSSSPPVVSGQTQLRLANGTGNFTDLKVRGRPGEYVVTFDGEVRDRQLAPLDLKVGKAYDVPLGTLPDALLQLAV